MGAARRQKGGRSELTRGANEYLTTQALESDLDLFSLYLRTGGVVNRAVWFEKTFRSFSQCLAGKIVERYGPLASLNYECEKGKGRKSRSLLIN